MIFNLQIFTDLCLIKLKKNHIQNKKKSIKTSFYKFVPYI